MSGPVETTEVDPTQAIGRLLPEGWRVERTFAYDGGTILGGAWEDFKRIEHGETVTVVVEPADVPLYGLTIQQPYASLIAHGIKTIETRGFQPRVVKPGADLAIVAGATCAVGHGNHIGPNWRLTRSDGDPYLHSLDRPVRYIHLHAGAVVAVARFVEALPMLPPGDLTRPHIGLSELSPGEWASTCIYRPGVMPDQSPMDQYHYGQWAPGRFGWLLDNIRRLPEPIPCTGFQGLRALPADVATATRLAAQ